MAAPGEPHSGCTGQCLGQVADRDGDQQFHGDGSLPEGKPEHQRLGDGVECSAERNGHSAARLLRL